MPRRKRRLTAPNPREASATFGAARPAVGELGGYEPSSSRLNSPLVQMAAKIVDFRAGTRRKTLMPNQQHPPSIAILRDATGRLALFINGPRSDHLLFVTSIQEFH
jgi:hypothetical protein